MRHDEYIPSALALPSRHSQPDPAHLVLTHHTRVSKVLGGECRPSWAIRMQTAQEFTKPSVCGGQGCNESRGHRRAWVMCVPQVCAARHGAPGLVHTRGDLCYFY